MLSTTHSAESTAAPDQLARRLFEPDALPLQSPGARVESADAGWPAESSSLRFRVMGQSLEATVLQNDLPRTLTMRVKSPMMTTTVHHRFVPLPSGGTRLEKTV